MCMCVRLEVNFGHLAEIRNLVRKSVGMSHHVFERPILEFLISFLFLCETFKIFFLLRRNYVEKQCRDYVEKQQYNTENFVLCHVR